MLVAVHWDIKCGCGPLCFYFGCKLFKTYWWYTLTDAFHYQHEITSGSWCQLCASLVKYLYTVLRGLLWNFTPTSLLHTKWDGKHTFPIQSQKTACCYRKLLKKPHQQQPNHFLVNLVWRQHTSAFLLSGQWRYSLNAFHSTCLIIMLLIVGKRGWRNERLKGNLAR